METENIEWNEKMLERKGDEKNAELQGNRMPRYI